MDKKPHLKLSPLEKTAICLLIPINVVGYSIKNRKNLISTAQFYYGWKREGYEKIINILTTNSGLDEMLEKYMPLLSFRLMIRVGLNRTTHFTVEDYWDWAMQHPINWDRTFNPKYVPRRE